MDDTIAMPFRDIDGESGWDRTRRMLHHKPEVLEHVAGNIWNATSDDDRRFEGGWREVFAALPEETRAAWKQAVFDRIDASEKMTDSEREAASAKAWKDTLAHNDEVLRRLESDPRSRSGESVP